MTALVDRADLGPLTLIKSGGFGDVYRAERARLPGSSVELAYKKFTAETATQTRATALAVEMRDGLTATERAVLDELTVWPRALVGDTSGQVCGLLMPVLAPGFFTEVGEERAAGRSRVPRELAWLTASRAQRSAAGADLPEVALTDRLAMLAQLAYVVAWLHQRGWVYGDLNLHNVAFADTPARIKLLDCDSAARLCDLERRQGHCPAWEPPECVVAPGEPRVLQDFATDVYKLGLAILRCLTPGKHAATRKSTTALRGVLDGHGVDLVRAAISERAKRPTARDLYAYLHAVVRTRTDPPRVISVGCASGHAVRGQDIHIEWQVTGATEAVITAGNRRQTTVDLADHPTGYALRAEASGPVVVEFRNTFASVTAGLGDLNVHELPPFSLPPKLLPRLCLPGLPGFEFPPHGVPGMPVLASLGLPGLFEQFNPHREVVGARSSLDSVIAGAFGKLRQLVGSVGAGAPVGQRSGA